MSSVVQMLAVLQLHIDGSQKPEFSVTRKLMNAYSFGLILNNSVLEVNHVVKLKSKQFVQKLNDMCGKCQAM
jgi:hypothetical protein